MSTKVYLISFTYLNIIKVIILFYFNTSTINNLDVEEYIENKNSFSTYMYKHTYKSLKIYLIF